MREFQIPNSYFLIAQRYLNIVEPDREDLDDIDVRARLLERSFGRELSAVQLLGREIVANKIFADDPPEAWATAERLLAAGLDREDVFRQLSMAFGSVARSSSDVGGFDRDGVDKEFFAGTRIKSNFLCALGHGNPAALHPRAPRLSFDQACRIL